MFGAAGQINLRRGRIEQGYAQRRPDRRRHLARRNAVRPRSADASSPWRRTRKPSTKRRSAACGRWPFPSSIPAAGRENAVLVGYLDPNTGDLFEGFVKRHRRTVGAHRGSLYQDHDARRRNLRVDVLGGYFYGRVDDRMNLRFVTQQTQAGGFPSPDRCSISAINSARRTRSTRVKSASASNAAGTAGRPPRNCGRPSVSTRKTSASPRRQQHQRFSGHERLLCQQPNPGFVHPASIHAVPEIDFTVATGSRRTSA